MKHVITLEQALDLIAKSYSQFIGGNDVSLDFGEITGEPDNSIIDIRWESEGLLFGVSIIEEGLADGSQKIWWDDSEGILYLPDDDGDEDNPIELQLVVKMGSKYFNT